MQRLFAHLGLGTACVAAAITLAACGSSTSTGSGGSSSAAAGSSSGGKTFTIGVSNPIAANPAVNNWQKGLEVQAKALGMKVIAADANLDPNKQLNDVRSLLNRNIDALVISPLDPKGLAPVLSQAQQRHIPVIGWSSGGGPLYATDFETNDFDAGKQAAQVIAQKVGQGAEVAAIEGVPQIPIAKLRGDGFKAGAKAYGLKLVAEQVNPKDSADGARPIAQAWRTKYGASLKAIFSYNDPSALGASSVVGGDFKPVLTGINGSTEGIAAVRNGQIAATWDQRTVDVGNASAWAAYQILAKKAKLPPVVTALMPRWDKQNVAKWKSPDVLLQGPLKIKIVTQGNRSLLETSQ